MAWSKSFFASSPLAFGFAFHAWRRAADRWAAYLALVLSGAELLLWLVVGSTLV